MTTLKSILKTGKFVFVSIGQKNDDLEVFLEFNPLFHQCKHLVLLNLMMFLTLSCCLHSTNISVQMEFRKDRTIFHETHIFQRRKEIQF